MKKRKPTAKQRELQAAWEKIKTKHASPPKFAFDPTTTLKVASRHKPATPAQESFVDRLSRLKPDASEWTSHKTSTVHNHCIMPMHKGGYQVVTDPEMMKLMGKKP